MSQPTRKLIALLLLATPLQAQEVDLELGLLTDASMAVRNTLTGCAAVSEGSMPIGDHPPAVLPWFGSVDRVDAGQNCGPARGGGVTG